MRKTLAVIISLAMIVGLFGIVQVSATTETVSSIERLIQIRDDINSGARTDIDEIIITGDLDFESYAATHYGADPNVLYVDGNYVYNWEPIWQWSGRLHSQSGSVTIRNLYIDPMAAVTDDGTGNFTLNWSQYELNNIGFISVLGGNSEIYGINLQVKHIEGHHNVAAYVGRFEDGYIHDCELSSTGSLLNYGKCGLIIGLAGVGGFAGAAMDMGAGQTYTDTDELGLTTGSGVAKTVIERCTVDQTVQIRAVTLDYLALPEYYSTFMNPNQSHGYIDGNGNVVYPGYTGYTDIVSGLVDVTEEALDASNRIFSLNIFPGSPFSYKEYVYVNGVLQYDNSGSILEQHYQDVGGCFAGGICGIATDNGVRIHDCENNGYVRAMIMGAGGIAGITVHSAMITDCRNTDKAYVAGGTFCNSRYLQTILDGKMDNEIINQLYEINGNHGDDHLGYDFNHDGAFNDADLDYCCSDDVGGIVGLGLAGTIIERCSNEGYVETEGRAGGIAGRLDGPYRYEYPGVSPCWYSRVTNCFNTGHVYSDTETGGIVGLSSMYYEETAHYTDTVNIICPYCGNGSGTETVHGFCDNTIENCYNIGEVENCNAGGPPHNLTGHLSYGGIAGTNHGVISNCYSWADYLIESRIPTYASICGDNFGLIDHCFGGTPVAHYSGSIPNNGNPQGLTPGICTNYRQFSFATGVPATIQPGNISGSTDMKTELNAFVTSHHYGRYQYAFMEFAYADYPYLLWVDDVQNGYIPFGKSYPDTTSSTADYTRYNVSIPRTYAPVGYSLTLDGDIGMNCYIAIDEPLDDCRAVFSVKTRTGTTEFVSYLDPAKFDYADGTLCYKFTCPVAAAQIDCEIKGYVINGETVGDIFTCSVNEYIDLANNSPEYQNNQDLMNLMGSLADYGYYANAMFRASDDFEAPAAVGNYYDDPFRVTSADLAAYGNNEITDGENGVDFYGSSLVLLSKTSLRYYFTVPKGRSIDEFAFRYYAEGSEEKITVDPVQKGSLWYVEIAGIESDNLDKTYFVEVTDADGNDVCNRWGYSALAYAYTALYLYETEQYNVRLALICKALYLYNVYADAYFSN